MTDTPLTLPYDEGLLSPYMAAQEGLDDAKLDAFFERIAAQPLEISGFIESAETFYAVRKLVADGTIPVNFGVAVAKLVALLAMGDVQTGQLPKLLGALGMDAPTTARISEAILDMVTPVLTRISGAPAAQLEPLPPLTQRIGPPVPPAPAQIRAASPNVVDLRNKPAA